MFLLSIVRNNLFCFLLLPGINSFGQGTAVATASATIVAPNDTLKLETFYSASFSTYWKADNIQSCGNEVFLQKGNIKSFVATIPDKASFNITGSNYCYYITLPPSDIILKRDRGWETITITSFQLSHNAGTNTINPSLALTATVIINTNPIPGTYTSITPISITVNYN